MKLCLRCQSEFDGKTWACPQCSYAPDSENGFLLFAPELNETDLGFNREVFDDLHAAEKKNFWFRIRNQLITWAISKYFPRAESLLEIGCGTGFVLTEIESRFPAITCAGSEVHTRALDIARQRVNDAPLWQMDARNLPFSGEFDIVGAFDVLEHIKDDKEVLGQMNKSVRPGGGIILTVPQHPFLWSKADEYACHERRYAATELRLKVTAAGFRVVRSTSFVSILLPLMAVSRLKSRLPGATYDPESELNPESVINWLFEKVMGFEANLIRHGISFPLGGSLLLVAYKDEGS